MLKELNIQDIYRASSIKRWQIVRNHFEQDIAQHSFNVAHIARELVLRLRGRFKWYTNIMRYTLEWSLIHDISEIFTGDVPTPLKKELGLHWEDWESSTVINFLNSIPMETKPEVLAIVKVADFLCAMKFIRINYSIEHHVHIFKSINKSLEQEILLLDVILPKSAEIVETLKEELINGKENFL